MQQIRDIPSWREQRLVSAAAALIDATAALWRAGLGRRGARGDNLDLRTGVGLPLGVIAITLARRRATPR